MNKEQSLWFLENIDVTGLFCPNKVDAGDLDQTTHREFKKGDYIFLPDEHADKVYFIFEGRVKIGTYGEEGKEITKVMLNSGEVFGELAMIGGDGKRRDSNNHEYE